MRRVIYLLFAVLFSCSEPPAIEGLWELQKVDIDMIPKRFKPTYLKIERGGSFYLSKEEGDLIGFYKLEHSVLSFSSEDEDWFNKSWKVFTKNDELVLNHIKNSYRGAQLRFKKIDKFPGFEEFQQSLNGTWELYKTTEKGQTKVVLNTRFIIEDDHYIIQEGSEVLEQGKVRVDTRHQKMTFENAEMVWDARFVWDELRLENNNLELMYRLRKNR